MAKKKSRKVRAAARAGKAPQRSENKQKQAQSASQKLAQQPAQASIQKSAQQPAAVVVNALQPGQYDYVKGDLIRIGIISTILIVIIIVLTFIPALKT